jgi:cell division GTPase FtsZ
MREKVLWVGLGATGNNFCSIAKNLGFRVTGINTSINDLRATNLEDSEQFLIRGSNGAGKDREYAKSLLDIEAIIRFFHANIRNYETKIVFIVYGAGGGTGSGISALIAQALSYEFPEITFVAMPVLPELNEPYGSQVNTLFALQELSELDIAVMPIDNGQAKTVNPNLVKYRIYEYVNERVVKLVNDILTYTELDSRNQFDETDLLRVFSERGICTIADADIVMVKGNFQLNKESVVNAVQNSWYQSIFAAIEYDLVSKVAIIYDGQESLLDFVDHDLILSKFQTKPMFTFTGEYQERNGKIVTVLSGLSWCKTRVEQIEKVIEDNKSRYEEVMSSANYRYEAPRAITDLAKQIHKKPTQQEKPNWREILNKYKK